MTDGSQVSDDIRDAFELEPGSIEAMPGGLINTSFAAMRRDGQACVLQRVNPIFPPAIHEDIESVTRHLLAHGLATPVLIPDREDRLYLARDGEIWRLMTRIEGETHERLHSDAEAFEAGRVLGAFHAALADYERPLANPRGGVHDIARHIGNLRRSLSERADHPAHGELAPVAGHIIELAESLPPLPAMPARMVHGDPKISNVVFAGERAVCLVDLDTIARESVALELGDALRSWCNIEAEDSPDAAFAIERFRSALAGYRESAGELLTPAEWQAIADATVTIAVELAARFAADALNESYFSWDRKRFASASAHNLARVHAQLALARSMQRTIGEMRKLAVTVP